MDLNKIYEEVSRKIKGMTEEDVAHLSKELKKSSEKSYILDVDLSEFHTEEDGFHLDFSDTFEQSIQDKEQRNRYKKEPNKLKNNKGAFAA